MTTSESVLEFWFGTADLSRSEIDPRSEWFRKNEAFDDEIRREFGAAVEQAGKGELDAWRASAATCLALVVLLDQFPRNLFRGTANAFARDPLALAHALHALEQGFDREIAPVARWFFYLPLEHAESLALQEESVKRFRALGEDTPGWDMVTDYAQRHLDVIARFGRFPGRNEALGRESTPEEAEFLKQPGSRF
jgi:uncharacterized protein (DUF924 family)